MRDPRGQDHTHRRDPEDAPHPDRFRESITFAPNDSSKTYLERELPLEEANSLTPQLIS